MDLNRNVKIVKENPILQYKVNELIDDSDGPLMSLPYIEMHVNRNFIENINKPTTILEDIEDQNMPAVASNRVLFDENYNNRILQNIQKNEFNQITRPVNLKLNQEEMNNDYLINENKKYFHDVNFSTPQFEHKPKPRTRKIKSTSSAETPIEEKACPICTFLCNKTINFCPMCDYFYN